MSPPSTMNKPKNKTDKKEAPRLIAENRRARYDYFIEERLEAGLVLQGWEVKSMRAGKAQVAEAYVYLKEGEAFLFGANITPLKTASTHLVPDPDPHPQTTAEQVGAVAAGRQRRAQGLHAGAARPALEGWPRQTRDRPRQGQEAARQTRHRKRSRLAARQGTGNAARLIRNLGGLIVATDYRTKILVPALFALTFTAVVRAAPPPIEAFGRKPAMIDVDINPAGTRLAWIEDDAKMARIVILDLATGKTLRSVGTCAQDQVVGGEVGQRRNGAHRRKHHAHHQHRQEVHRRVAALGGHRRIGRRRPHDAHGRRRA